MDLDWNSAATQGPPKDVIAISADGVSSAAVRCHEALVTACSVGELLAVKSLLAALPATSGAEHDTAPAVGPAVEQCAPFRAACREGHIDVVRFLLSLRGEMSVDPTARQCEAFREACARGHTEVVRELLALEGGRAINVNVREQCVLQHACLGGHVGVLRLLLALEGERRMQPAVSNYACFRLACSAGKLGVVRELLALTGDRRIEVNAANGVAFDQACKNGHIHVVRELLAITGEQEVVPQRGLKNACANGHAHVVQELLAITGRRQVDPLTQNAAALHAACSAGHVGVLRELLALTGERQVPLGGGGAFPLKVSCRFGHLRLVQELFALPPGRLNRRADSYQEAFCDACQHGHEDIVGEFLAGHVEHPVELGGRAADALRLAAGAGHLGIVNKLLSITGEHSVNVAVVLVAAVSAATVGNHPAVVGRLLALGAAKDESLHQSVLCACRNGLLDVLHEFVKVRSGGQLALPSAHRMAITMVVGGVGRDGVVLPCIREAMWALNEVHTLVDDEAIESVCRGLLLSAARAAERSALDAGERPPERARGMRVARGPRARAQWCLFDYMLRCMSNPAAGAGVLRAALLGRPPLSAGDLGASDKAVEYVRLLAAARDMAWLGDASHPDLPAAAESVGGCCSPRAGRRALLLSRAAAKQKRSL